MADQPFGLVDPPSTSPAQVLRRTGVFGSIVLAIGSLGIVEKPVYSLLYALTGHDSAEAAED